MAETAGPRAHCKSIMLQKGTNMQTRHFELMFTALLSEGSYEGYACMGCMHRYMYTTCIVYVL